MIERCKICGEIKEPVLSPEKEKMADMLYDTLSDAADQEGSGVLSDIEFNFICGRICKKCFLNKYRENGGFYE